MAFSRFFSSLSFLSGGNANSEQPTMPARAVASNSSPDLRHQAEARLREPSLAGSISTGLIFTIPWLRIIFCAGLKVKSSSTSQRLPGRSRIENTGQKLIDAFRSVKDGLGGARCILQVSR